MKYRVLLQRGILLVFLFILCGCGSELQLYDNPEYGFSVLLPGSWQKEEGALKSVVMALAPTDNRRTPQPPKPRANVNVFVTEFPEEIKLDTVFELNKDELSKFGAAIQDLREGEIYAGLLAGRWLSFEGSMHDSRLKIISAIWVKGRHAYTITCSSSSEEFSRYEPIFNKVLRSLRVK